MAIDYLSGGTGFDGERSVRDFLPAVLDVDFVLTAIVGHVRRFERPVAVVHHLHLPRTTVRTLSIQTQHLISIIFHLNRIIFPIFHLICIIFHLICIIFHLICIIFDFICLICMIFHLIYTTFI